jgi:hypothetical protein
MLSSSGLIPSSAKDKVEIEIASLDDSFELLLSKS